MRQRITYFHRAAGDLEPNALKVSKEKLSVHSLNASKESRFSLGLHELPQELQVVLGQCHELHIRWSSAEVHGLTPPLVSRIPPGLHLFFTPHARKKPDAVCPLLRKAFGDELHCRSPQESFTPIPILSERFSSSTASQYYQSLASLDALNTYLQHKACAPSDTPCHDEVSSLRSAKTVLVDYDAISHMLLFTAFWDAAPGDGLWNEDIRNVGGSEKTEVGVLAPEKADEPEELSLSGFLTVVGEDDKPAPTLFSFPSRHHALPEPARAQFITSFLEPTGLHPSLRIAFSSAPSTPPTPSCALHAYLTLPSHLFVDRYQLSDPLFLASKNLRAVRTLYGETDLEAPDWVIGKWGSVLLLELASPDQSDSGDHTADIPLHLRYLDPRYNASGISEVQVPSPAIFWACDAEDGLKMSVNPFDRVKLGYDGLFGPKTMFYHFSPDAEAGNLMQTVRIPVLDLDRASWVETGTVVSVVLGFFWVCLKLWGAVTGPSRGRPNAERKKTS